MKFYPADWQADELLGMCTLAARGLWIEMLGIMHKADPYGHLVVNGRPPTDTQLAALARCPPDQIPSLLEELENAGVFSRTRTRVIYSRRMTRDERRSKDGRAGKLTGQRNPNSRRGRHGSVAKMPANYAENDEITDFSEVPQATEKIEDKYTTLKVAGMVVDKPPSPQKPEARGQNRSGREKNPKKSQGEIECEFDEFWRAYPRKQDRGRALKAYMRARRAAAPRTLLEAAANFARRRSGEDPRYTPLAATWLNGERWLDEASPETASAWRRARDAADEAEIYRGLL